METEAATLNRNRDDLVKVHCVLPHNEKIAIGKKGLTLETLPTCVRRVGKKGVSNGALSAERLCQQEPSKPQEAKACGKALSIQSMLPLRVAVPVVLLLPFPLIATGRVDLVPTDLEAAIAVDFEPAQAGPPLATHASLRSA